MSHNCKYTSTKTYHQAFPVAYRQWRADRKSGKTSGMYTQTEIPGCNAIHGYALSMHFEFSTDVLDARNWVMDFGGLRELKNMLDEYFDHTLLLAQDDPDYDQIKALGTAGLAKITEVERTGCEGIADWLYEYINTIFLPNYGEADRIWCTKIEVRETDKNMAFRSGYRDIE